MPLVPVPTLLVEKWNFVQTGNPVIDDAMRARVDAEGNTAWLEMLYENQTDSLNRLFFYDLDTAEPKINADAVILFLEENNGLTPSTSPPLWVALDIETGVGEIINYTNDEAVLLYQQNMLKTALQAIKAHFGDGIRIGIWGMPSVTNGVDYDNGTPWLNSSDEMRERRKQESVRRYGPFLAVCDYLMPNAYIACPTPDQMDPATRDWEVLTGGYLVLEAPPGQFDYGTASEGWITFHEAMVEAADRIVRLYGLDIPVIVSIATLYAPITPIFDQTLYLHQYVPTTQLNAHIARIRGKSLRPYNLWNDNEHIHWVATLHDLQPQDIYYQYQLQMRKTIVDAHYGGVSPVPGTFPNWQSASFAADAAEKSTSNEFALLTLNNESDGTGMPLTYEEAANSIRSRWKLFMEDGQSLTTQHDNAPARKLDGLHCELTILWGENEAVSAPHGDRAVGTINCNLRIPAGRGDRSGSALIGAIVEAFNRKSFGGIVCRNVSPTNMGQQGAFHQINVRVPFFFDSTT